MNSDTVDVNWSTFLLGLVTLATIFIVGIVIGVSLCRMGMFI